MASEKPSRFLPWTGWIVLLLGLTSAGWMTFDGSRALVVGDYVRPQTGEYAGQLGPWTHAVEAVGIDPESPVMKGVFVVEGVLGLLALVWFTTRRRAAWWVLLGWCLSTLWYLPFGTLIALLNTILLNVRPLRTRYARP